MIHKTELDSYEGGLLQLAIDLGDLRYDALADFLHQLSAKMEADGKKDQARSRVQLARQLHQCASELSAAASSIDRAWKICEPFM